MSTHYPDRLLHNAVGLVPWAYIVKFWNRSGVKRKKSKMSLEDPLSDVIWCDLGFVVLDEFT